MYTKKVLPTKIIEGEDFTFAEWIEEPNYIRVAVLAEVNGSGKKYEEEFIVNNENFPVSFSADFEKIPKEIQRKMISLCKILIREKAKNRASASKEKTSQQHHFIQQTFKSHCG